MAELDHIIARLSRLGIITSTDEAPGSVLSKAPETISADDTSLDKPSNDDLACDITSLTSSKVAQLSRIDSHEETAEDIDSLKSQLAQAQEELRQIKNKRLQGLKKGGVLANKLKQCEYELKQTQLANIYLERRDSERAMELDGRFSTAPDNIHIEKFPGKGNDLSMKVVLSRTFTFTERYKSAYEMVRDNAAIGCLRLNGRLYIAKSGKTREDFGDFINSDHWTSRAVVLGDMVKFHITTRWATHVEPQLMVFYITRTLSESGHILEDFVNTPIVPAKGSRTELKNIIIGVSEPICDSCTKLTAAVNGFAENHGYRFTLDNRRKITTNGNKQGSSDPQPVRFADR
ncbi:uncharacterized protein J4E87_006822 [Alternaria ethzedia]|uniref:uncharacterized protein n=1 Tax=Alternaria ethzedia TaxID=181014 RepID=UPI0020C20B67|nr:uncharacterized protein J4E87_006822 [Alternaria ethzedia]KAI4621194.1 hypothetical protein J4E87_006822 [Alternaria ethzedia]